MPVTVRNSFCSGGIDMGAMVFGLYWELAPSIKAVVHLLKGSTPKLYAWKGFEAIFKGVAGAGIPPIGAQMLKQLFRQATAMGCTPMYRLMFGVRIWPDRIPRRVVSIPNRY